LLPGQRQPVRILYRHDHVGEHALCALLTVKDGKGVRVELEGRTVALEAKCLSLGPGPAACTVHTLAPVLVGDQESPAQAIELRNPSATDVRYTVDEAPVRALNAAARTDLVSFSA
jgi:hypothetical protein